MSERITLLSNVPGDHSARARIVVADTSGHDQRGLIAGVRSRHYSENLEAALVYEAEKLTPMDAATVVTLTGASGAGTNNVVKHNALLADWTNVLSTDILSPALGGMTHTGTYRVWARCYNAGDGLPNPFVRLLYDVGDFTNPVQNASMYAGATDAFMLINLGEIRLDPAPSGPHRWRGIIQAKSAGANISIDKLYFIPVDEGYVELSAPIVSDEGLSPFTSLGIRDSFTGTTAGTALNGSVADGGGTWATSGATTDYVFADAAVGDGITGFSTESVKRSTISEASGRVAVLGTNDFTDVQVDVLQLMSNYPQSTSAVRETGLIARWVDSSNYLRGVVKMATVSGLNLVRTLEIVQVVAGVTTILSSTSMDSPVTIPTTGIIRGVRLIALASGSVSLQLLDTSQTVLATAATSAPVFATGGTLASGKVGIYDRNSSTTATTRFYDDFVAFAPVADAVVHANMAAEIRWDGMYREDATGVAFGPVSHIVGDYLRLPPSGLEERPTELIVVTSRGDLGSIPDSGVDDTFTVDAYGRPTWLFMGE